MILFDPEPVAEFLFSQGAGRQPPGTFSAIGWVEDGKIVAGAAAYGWNEANLWGDIAVLNGRLPRKFLKAIFLYCFVQVKAKRLSFSISSANIRSQRFVEKLGAIREATLSGAHPDGDLYIYALFPGRCRIWSRLNEQPESAESARSEGRHGSSNAVE